MADRWCGRDLAALGEVLKRLAEGFGRRLTSEPNFMPRGCSGSPRGSIQALRAQELEEERRQDDAERKRAAAQTAKQKQSESAEPQRQKRACIGTCKMHCSTSDAFRYSTCLDGCVESNCQ
jgi:hypothetical protein